MDYKKKYLKYKLKYLTTKKLYAGSNNPPQQPHLHPIQPPLLDLSNLDLAEILGPDIHEIITPPLTPTNQNSEKKSTKTPQKNHNS